MFYLPALEARPELARSLRLVDTNLERAEALRARVGAAAAVTDHREALDGADAVIIAAPHHVHAPLTLECIERGIHVLCEKPLCSSAAEADRIVAASREKSIVVAVNHTRRLQSSTQEARRLATSGAIGKLRRIECSLGGAFGWPAASNTYFGTAAGGRGVLFDFGPHVLDLVCWFMGGKPEVVSYADDSYGGTEAVARVELALGEVTARVHLSWLSQLGNGYEVFGSDGSIGGQVLEGSEYFRRDASGRARTVRTGKAREFTYYAEKLLDNFTAAIAGRERPIVTPEDVRPSVALIEECYARRTRLDAPWYDACERLAHV